MGQPPCEAVSWNFLVILKLNWDIRQPPCEAVSWNGLKSQMAQSVFVSLLVRLWVEIVFVLRMAYVAFVSLLVRLWVEISLCPLASRIRSVSLLVRLWVEISSLWVFRLLSDRQPPCEAVSWNASSPRGELSCGLSASLWGCELK